jgi:demethylmenaquinone methyltransferase/2-methoxy-6-polyprenyl-1,4-benzoquinol methylase
VRLLRLWPSGAAARSAYAERIFATVADRYDLFTRLLSFGADARWKRSVARAALDASGGRVLDLATGTGAIPEAVRRLGYAGSIVGLDRSGPMILRGADRLVRARVTLARGDLNRLPLRAGSFDAITMGYGLRYIAELDPTLRELHDLLRPSGVLVSLDFGRPESAFLRAACHAYLLAAGSLWGLLLHGRPGTYLHIVESLRAYPGQGAVAEAMGRAGFVQVERRDLMGGIAALLTARRAPAATA